MHVCMHVICSYMHVDIYMTGYSKCDWIATSHDMYTVVNVIVATSHDMYTVVNVIG